MDGDAVHVPCALSDELVPIRLSLLIFRYSRCAAQRRPNLCPPRLHLAHRPFPPPTGCSIIVQEEMPVAPAIEEEIEEVAAAAEQVVTPWEVSAPGGIIDYDKLVDQFGCQRIDAAMVDRIELCYGTPE